MPLPPVHREEGEKPFPWHLQVYDAHCHPTDTMNSVESISTMKAKVLTIMATRANDQELVAATANRMGVRQSEEGPLSAQWEKQARVVPCFGWHPWFSHQIYEYPEFDGAMELSVDQKLIHYSSVLTPKCNDKEFMLALPEPRPLSKFLSAMREYLEKYPLALVGEVGLDKRFCLPANPAVDVSHDSDCSSNSGGRDGLHLSPYHSSKDHQRKILKAQLALAGELQRAVSIHGVQAHGALFESLKGTWKGYENKTPNRRERRLNTNLRAQNPDDDEKQTPKKADFIPPYPPRICLHSFTGPPEQGKFYLSPSIPVEVFFSFSTLVNFYNKSDKKVKAAEDTIIMLPADRILVESDLDRAGEAMDDYLEDITRRVCKIRGWGLEEGVLQLGKNWKRFVFGERDVDS
ncbi:Metallo-dependent hydrolase [Tothia fuscella]|uniref:Metallo-dependent hydrolase n=1 Tax=Tothia fuscella TaxID=1048955 RepID=A0A9P4NG23_9PEZI|nr:Metallo-dependent hydrolase [Tothia fuscella]